METISTLDLVSVYGTDNIVAQLGDDFMVLDIKNCRSTDFPFKIDSTGFCLCTDGAATGSIDLMPCQQRKGTLTVNLPGQLLGEMHVSSDYRAIGIMMS